MRLDHIAYRVADRHVAAKFFCDAFGYRISDEFTIKFNNGETARCFVLEPPEEGQPLIFVSDGTPGSIPGQWVSDRGGIGGVHHLAYEVEDVMATMDRWRTKRWAQFTTEIPIRNSDDLEQCFTEPHPITGVVYEFIKRGKDNKSFNIDSVRDLMESTSGL